MSYWNRDRPFADPFCGSGTLPIEAALIGAKLAPGLRRTFLAETWPGLSAAIWSEARTEAKDAVVAGAAEEITGYDLDGRSVETARRHAAAAGVSPGFAKLPSTVA